MKEVQRGGSGYAVPLPRFALAQLPAEHLEHGLLLHLFAVRLVHFEFRRESPLWSLVCVNLG